MNFRITFVKGLIVPGATEEDDPSKSYLLKRDAVMPFVPFLGMTYLYYTEDAIFEEIIEDIAWLEEDKKFEVHFGIQAASAEDMARVLQKHSEAGWVTFGDDEEDEDSMFKDELFPKDLDDNLRGT